MKSSGSRRSPGVKAGQRGSTSPRCPGTCRSQPIFFLFIFGKIAAEGAGMALSSSDRPFSALCCLWNGSRLFPSSSCRLGSGCPPSQSTGTFQDFRDLRIWTWMVGLTDRVSRASASASANVGLVDLEDPNRYPLKGMSLLCWPDTPGRPRSTASENSHALTTSSGLLQDRSLDLRLLTRSLHLTGIRWGFLLELARLPGPDQSGLIRFLVAGLSLHRDIARVDQLGVAGHQVAPHRPKVASKCLDKSSARDRGPQHPEKASPGSVKMCALKFRRTRPASCTPHRARTS